MSNTTGDTASSSAKQSGGLDSSDHGHQVNREIDRGESQRGKRGQRGGRGRRGGGSIFKRRYTGDSSSWGQKRRKTVAGGDMSEMSFLLGGNMKDPLNLESVKPVDEAEIMKPLELVIPKNMHDPLNLRSITRNRNKRKRRNSKQTETLESPTGTEEELRRRANTFASYGDHKQHHPDPIVSPIPFSVVKKMSAVVPSAVRKESAIKPDNSNVKDVAPQAVHQQAMATSSKLAPESQQQEAQKHQQKHQEHKNKQKDRFRYGNFNRYYGTRLENGTERDPRLSIMKKEWFTKKAVLDIGCNAGYVTLTIAKEFEPRRIIGIDIDEHLVGVARKNIRHYCDTNTEISGNFPASFAHRYGPIAVHSAKFSTKFPDNVWFRRENYVLDNDEALEQVEEEFDVILALSITKWIHLNWGDAGLKRFFQRAFKHLRPGGVFILEPQVFESYRKRAKMTPEVQETFKGLKLLPDGFQEFLICEVGFESCEHLETPKAKSKGFERPMQVYRKRAPKFAGSSKKNDGASVQLGKAASKVEDGLKSSEKNSCEQKQTASEVDAVQH